MYKCLFKQEILKRHYVIETTTYGLNSEFSKVIEDEPILIEEKVIGTGELNEPFLEIGDKCYIPNIGKIVKIAYVILSLRVDEQDESVIYYIEPEYIENEEEKNALCEKCEKITLERRFKMLERNLTSSESFQEKVKSNFWYRFMKRKVEGR